MSVWPSIVRVRLVDRAVIPHRRCGCPRPPLRGDEDEEKVASRSGGEASQHQSVIMSWMDGWIDGCFVSTNAKGTGCARSPFCCCACQNRLLALAEGQNVRLGLPHAGCPAPNLFLLS